MSKKSFLGNMILIFGIMLVTALTGCDLSDDEPPESIEGPLSGGGKQSNPFQLINGVWADGSIASSESAAVWYTFEAVQGTTYRVWENSGYQGDNTKTGFIYVTASYADGTPIFTKSEYGLWNSPQSFTANTSGTVFIRITPVGTSSGKTGTYGIVYSNGSTRP